MDLTKMGYKSHLEEGVGALPTLKVPVYDKQNPVIAKKKKKDGRLGQPRKLTDSA